MFYRCLNDRFGYCKGKPEINGEELSEDVLQVKPLYMKTCKLNKATCGKYSTTHCSKVTIARRQLNESTHSS